MADTSGAPVVITGDNQSYSVNAGTTVDAAGSAAALTTAGMNDTVAISGTLTADGGDGLLVSAGAKTVNPAPYPTDGAIFGFDYFSYANGSASVSIAGSGQVTGTVGVLAQVPLDDMDVAKATGGTVSLQLDNAGTISGTGGIAVAAEGLGAAISSLVNEANGTIRGSIEGVVDSLNNAGMIDAAARTAIDIDQLQPIANSGTITSHNDFATVIGRQVHLDNAGTVSNSGSGVAIESDHGTITNEAGGTISGGIFDAEGLTLVNKGTINGDVESVDNYYSATIDQSGGGTINGNVTFVGETGEVFIARGFNADGTIDTGVTGTLDGGDGYDVIETATSENVSVSGALPTNFEQLQINITHGAIVTESGQGPASVAISGKGSFVNNGAMNAVGNYAIGEVSNLTSGTLDVHNNGTVTTSLSQGPYAYGSTAINFGDQSNVGGAHLQSFTNSGTISAQDAAAVSINTQEGRYFAFENSGSITGDSGAAAVRIDFSGTNTDSFLNARGGSIENLSGEALILSGFDGHAHQTAENDGTITGGSTAATFAHIDFTNAGTIHATAPIIDGSSNQAVYVEDASLTNSGKIASDGSVIALFADQDDTSSALHNHGLIQSYAATAVLIDSGTVSIDNAADGRIKGVTAIGYGDNYYHEYGAAITTITNEGHIYGGIDLSNPYVGLLPGEAGFSIENSGYIRGAVDLSSGDDIYDGHAGTLVGSVTGGDGDDVLIGGMGNDTLDGGYGTDTLQGDGGVDVLTGGFGPDLFVFKPGDSGLKAYSADEITDFSSGEGDRIDLSSFHPTTEPSASLHFIGTDAFDGTAGELRYYTHAGQTFVEVDLDGNGQRDLMIKLDGVHALATTDFVL